ncbi:putative ribonuclease H-like domain-containing protein [Tanacetum coccineum]
MVPRAVLMKSGLVSINIARQVNVAHTKTTVNAARPMSYLSKKAHSTVKRPIHKNTTFKNRQSTNGLQDQGLIYRGCSRHMTENMSYLIDYEEIDGGYVAFGGNPKGGKITRKGTIKTGNLDFENVYFVRELKFNLFSVSQMCDKKNSVLFNDTECIVLSPNFKLIDESQVLLRVPRKNNMYSVDLKNIVPKRGLTCLFAKATSDESKLWHRRLGHLNFKTMNKLVKGNLVRGLPSKLFENDQTCVACLKGKQHRASCKFKTENSISLPLHLLYMDLFGPTFVKSLMKKMYCLVVTDDFNRFTWVFFLATKDETSGILKSFITGIENLVDHKVKVIRYDNGTEFKNKEMISFAEAINTACYVQNRVLIVKPHNKIPYELFHGRTPTLSFMRPFGCPVTILNTIYHLGKFDGKADEGFFVGYSLNSKAFRVFNSRTRIVEENLHIRFSENTPNVVGSGLNWPFNIDALTITMNYEPIVIGTQSNGFVGIKANAGQARKETESSSHDDGFKPSSDDGKKVDEDSRKDSEGIDQEKEYNVNSTNNVNVTSTNKVNVVGGKTNIELPLYPNMPELEDYSLFKDDEDVGAEADMHNLGTTIQVIPILTTRFHKDHPLDQVIGDLQSATQTRRMSKSLEEHGFLQEVWTLVDLPNGKRVIGTKWVFRNKKDERGIMIRNKARLVAQVYIQEKGINYDEVFAPVARIEAIRLFLAYVSFKDFVVYQMDVKSAFLYGKIEEEVYICQPARFEDPDFSYRVYKVEKALYGQPLELGDILLVQVYVDDIIFGSKKKELCNAFKKLMHEKFQMSSMGELTFFLGLQVQQKKDGIFISQDKYVDEILKKFRFTKVKTASTPIETQKPLLKDKNGEEVDVHMYRSMIGSLMYLTSSRPDIMFVVCACARYQVNPKVSHLHVVKRIFRYLKGQPKLGLWYPKDSPFDLVAYTDSDYAGASLDKKYTIGGCQFLGYRLISWQCEKQIVVANSTIKAKYVAASSCCKNCQWGSTVTIPKDGKKKIITKSTMRRDLQPEDDDGVDCLSNATIFEQLALMSPKTTTWNEFSSTMASAIICLATNQKFNFSKFIFESMVKNLDNVGKFLMYLRTKKKDTYVPQSSVPSDIVADEAVYKELDDSLLRATTTASSLEAEQDSGNIIKTQSKATPNEAGSEGTTSGGGPRHQETMGDTIAQTRFVNVSKHSNDPLLARVQDLEMTKTTQAEEIVSLKRKVKKLEQKKRSRTHGLKRLYKVGLIARVEFSGDKESLGEDASKQGRINSIDADEDITLVNDQDDADMFDVNTLTGDEVLVEPEVAVKDVNLTVDEVTLAQALAALKSVIPKVKANVVEEPSVPVSAASTRVSAATTTTTVTILTPRKGIVITELGTSTTTTTTISSQPLQEKVQDKGKGIIVEEPVKSMKKKDLVRLDKEIPSKLQAEFDEEERLAREKDEANVALTEEWDDIQAKVDANY